jgi:hypothetical protein
MANANDELARIVYSMLQALTISAGRPGLISPIGTRQANQFNNILERFQQAFPASHTVRSMEPLADYDKVVLLITRLTILKSVVDRSTIGRWRQGG